MSRSLARSLVVAEPLIPFPVERVQQTLITWYRRHRRDLPWRRTNDPYRIWLSEVMLQQTRVDTAIAYYERFVRRFPNLEALAAAPVEEVLKLWEGLGYYRRARNFHAAAREVCEHYGGVVPDDPAVFGRLPGVGPYTLGAVLSIAFGRALPAVDGNVMRVVSRLTGFAEPIDKAAGRKYIEAVAERLVLQSAPGDWNQAMMELGALVCKPRQPSCEACPVAGWCVANQNGNAEALPLKGESAPVQEVDRAVAVLYSQGRVWLQKRPPEGLLAGLWDFPAVEAAWGTWNLPGEREKALLEGLREYGVRRPRILTMLGETTHTFSHVRWRMTVYLCTGEAAPQEGTCWAGRAELERLTLPKAVQRIVALLESAGIWSSGAQR